MEVEVVHAADGDEIVGAAASVGEREVHVPALWKMEAVVEAEDVVGVVETFLLAHADGIYEALLNACLYLWFVETPAMAVAKEAAPIPAMVDVGPGDVARLRVIGIRVDDAGDVILHVGVACLEEEVAIACLVLEVVALGWLQLAVSYLSHVVVCVNRARVQLLEGWADFGRTVAQRLGESACQMSEQEGRVEVVVFAMKRLGGGCFLFQIFQPTVHVLVSQSDS